MDIERAFAECDIVASMQGIAAGLVVAIVFRLLDGSELAMISSALAAASAIASIMAMRHHQSRRVSRP